MKKLLFFICLIAVFSCNKETLIETPEKGLEEKLVLTPAQMDDVISEERSAALSTSFMCTADPNNYTDCEVTFKVLCIDDCGRNILENGSVSISFRYHSFFADGAPVYAASNTNNWSSDAGGSHNLQIGQEYTLQKRVLASPSCPMFVWGEFYTGGLGAPIIGGTMYLEINGHMYYPIKVWNLAQCEEAPSNDWPDPAIHYQSIIFDDECYPSGRVDFPWDPCDNNAF